MADCPYTVARANLMRVRRQVEEHLCHVDGRVTIIEDYIGNAPPGGITFDYLYSTSLAGDPTPHYIAADDLIHANTTVLRMSITTANGNDATAFLQALAKGDIVGIFETVAPHGTAFWSVDEDPTDQGGYFTIPVTPATFAGQAMPALMDNPVTVYFIGNPNKLLPAGGDTGWILEKTTNEDWETQWVDGLTKFAPHDITHADLPDITPDNHHPHVHKLYGYDAADPDPVNQHSDVDLIVPPQERHVLSYQDVTGRWHPEFRMNWRGVWTPATYYKHDVVLDIPYTMAANKTTTDRAAPQPIGLPEYGFSDAPLWVEASQDAVVYSGHYYQFTETVEVNALRVWVPELSANTSYRVVIIIDPNGANPVYQTVEDPTLFENAWTVLSVNTQLMLAGTDAIIYLDSINSGGETTWAYNWNKAISSNTATPPESFWNTNVQQSILRINWLDAEAVPVSHRLELQVVPNTIFELSQVGAPEKLTHFRVNGAFTEVDNGDNTSYTWYNVTVIAQENGGIDDGAPSQIRAVQPVSDPTKFVYINDHWLGNQPLWGTVQSFLQYDGVTQPVDQNIGYGVDIAVQRLNISPDWDTVASFGTGGGGGEGAPFPEAPAGIPQPYGRDGEAADWTPVYSRTDADAKFLFNPVAYIDFQDGDGTAWQEGRVFWDEVEHSLSYYNDDSDITVNTGQELVAKVRNNTGATILNGSAVRVTGAIGNRPTVALALADKPSTSRVAGVMTHDLANNTDGYMTLIGVVRGFDTSAWAEGTTLYLSDSVAGELTDQQTQFSPPVAIVTLQNNVNGWMYVKPIREDGNDWWNVIDNDVVPPDSLIWGQNYRCDTPPQTVWLPPPDNDINEKTSNILVWNNSQIPDQTVQVHPASGTYFVFDGSTTPIDSPITVNNGEIVRLSTDAAGVAYALAIEAAAGFDGAGSFGFVRDPETESGRFLSDAGTWQPVISAPVGGLSIEYQYDADDGAPAAGFVNLDNVEPTLATTLRVNYTTKAGNSLETLIKTIRRGDYLFFNDELLGITYLFQVDDPINHFGTDYTEFGLQQAEVRPNPTDKIPDNADIKLIILPNPNAKFPTGGEENWVLSKASSVDYDMYWQDLDAKFPLDNVPQDNWTYGRYFNPTSGANEWHTGVVDPVSFKADNNFGIATLTPEYKLDINAGGVNDGLRILTTNTVAGIRLENEGGYAYVRSGGVSRGGLIFGGGAGAGEFARFEGDTGDLGIGITTPSYRLHVADDDVNRGGIRVQNTESGINGYMFAAGSSYSSVGLWQDAFGIEGSTGAHVFLSAYNGSHIKFGTGLRAERMRIDSGGNIGIGGIVANPEVDVHIRRDSQVTRSWSPDSAVGLMVEDNAYAAIQLAADTSSYIFFGTTDDRDAGAISYSTRMTLNSEGALTLCLSDGQGNNWLGIQTTAPKAPIHVYDGAALGQVAGNYKFASRLHGAGSMNNMYADQYWVRESAGGDWTSVVLHDSISVDSSYGVPRSTTRCFWERDPHRAVQMWGSGSESYMTLNSSGLRLSRDGIVGISATAQDRLHMRDSGWCDLRMDSYNANTDVAARIFFNNDNYGNTNTSYIQGTPTLHRHVIGSTVQMDVTASGVEVGDPATGGQGRGTINVTGNYYINGVPISTFIDAPADGNLYARKDNAWSSIGVGAGTVSDLSLTRAATTNEILNTGGDNVTLLSATTSLAGLMTSTDKSKLDTVDSGANNYVHPSYSGVDLTLDTGALTGAWVISDLDFHITTDTEGHVQDMGETFSTRQLTLADLGFTGDPDANDYVHPTYAGDDINIDTGTLSGAQVISRIDVNVTTDSTGHVTDANAVETVRTLTAEDIGATSVAITGAVETLTVTGVNATGTVIRTTIGNLVIICGRLQWTTGGTGTSSVYINGFDYPCTYATGFAVSVKEMNLGSSPSAGRMFFARMEAGATRLSLHKWGEAGNEAAARYDNLKSNGHMNINFSYYSDSVPTAENIHFPAP